MKKFCIKKTKGNIILLFVIGMLIGIILGLRQPIPEADSMSEPVQAVAVMPTDESVSSAPSNEAQSAIELGAESPVK